MPDTGIITDVVFEWKIENFFNLPKTYIKIYFSPEFSFGGERWYLRIFLNGLSDNHSSGHVDLDLCKCGSNRSIKLSFSLSHKVAKGEKYNEKHFTKDFDYYNIFHRFNRFIQRSELSRRRSDLVPEGVLTVVCTMKSFTSAESDTGKSREENSKNTCVEACTQTDKENDYNCREELLMALCIVSILIAIVTGCALAYCKTPLSSSHPCGDLVMSNEQLPEKIAQLKAVAKTLKARESELYAIKKEHGELQWFYESIASKKNKLEQNLVQLKKEMEEKQSKINLIIKELRKKETGLNDLKNKNEKLILKIKEIESEKKLLEEKATENENHNSSKDHGKELAATIIIFIIAIACVYVYSKTSLSVQHPYGEGTQTISAEEDNIVKADLSEVAETDEPEVSDSKTCATETEGPISFNNPLEHCGFVTDINHLLNENRGIDVTFELETLSGETKLFAHQLILAVMSSYFADKFYDKGRNKGHQIIPLKGIDPKAFEQMIRYCYGEKPRLRRIEDACALFKVASEFKVISLQNLCHTFFKHTKIEPGNVFSIMKISVEIEDQSLQDMCYKILQEKTREVMSAYELCDITPAMVYTLLNLPKLSLNSEYELINWIFDWAKVKSEDKNSSCRSSRDYLAKLLRNMNFLALTVKDFVMLTRDNPKFFNSNEIASVSMNIVIPGTREMPVWLNKDLKERVYTGSNE